jgi:hypothetical protein
VVLATCIAHLRELHMQGFGNCRAHLRHQGHSAFVYLNLQGEYEQLRGFAEFTGEHWLAVQLQPTRWQ